MRITFLGNCSNVTADREGVCFVVHTENCTILVDGSPGVVSRLYQAGINPAEIDVVVLTHTHGDHILGLPYFVFANFYERLVNKRVGPSSIQLFARQDAIDALSTMLEICHYDVSRYPFSLVPHAADSSRTMEFGSTRITAVPVAHAVPTIGVRIDDAGKSVTYSSDTVYADTVVELAKGSDLLLHEAMGLVAMEGMLHGLGHGVSRDAARAASDSGVPRLGLTHMLPALIGREEELVSEVREVFSGIVFVPDERSTVAV